MRATAIRWRALLEDLARVVDHRIRLNGIEIFAEHIVAPAQRIQRAFLRARRLGGDLAIHIHRFEDVVLRKDRSPRLHQQAFFQTVNIPAHQKDVRVVFLKLLVVFCAPKQDGAFFTLEFAGDQSVVSRGERFDLRSKLHSRCLRGRDKTTCP